MKSFKLVVTLLILGTLLASLAFAGSPQKMKGKNSQIQGIDPLNEAQPLQMGSRMVAQKGSKAVASNTRPVLQGVTLPTEPLGITSPLSGTYSVGVAGDFLNLTSAVAALNALGIDGSVVFELEDATYYESAIVMGLIAGSSDSTTITFRPAAGTAVTVNFDAAEYYGKGFSLMGAQYVIFDGINSGGASMTFQYRPGAAFPYDDATASTIYMGSFDDDVTSDITIVNMTVRSIANNTTWEDVTDVRHGIMVEGWDDYVYNVTIDSNTFGNAFYPILVEFANNLEIMNNRVGAGFDSYVGGGIYSYGSPNATISHNKIHGIKFLSQNWRSGWDFDFTGYWPWPGNPYLFGIVSQSAGGSQITYNEIYDVDLWAADPDWVDSGYAVWYGLRGVGSSSSNKCLVANNTQSYVRSTNDASGIWGIRAQNSSIYHNSFYFNGTTHPYAGGYMVLPVLGTATSVQIKNNIFYSEQGPTHYVYGGNSAPYTVGATDYNVADYPGMNILEYRGYGHDSNSVQGNPYFDDVATLEIDLAENSSASNIGTPIGAVTDDMAGNPRSGSTPDAGAYEFTMAAFTDVVPLGIPTPDKDGTVNGLPVEPHVQVMNNRPTSASVTVKLVFNDGTSDVYTSTTSSVSFAAFEVKTLSFPDFTPATNDPHTVTAIVIGDDEVANDTLTRAQPIVPVLAFSGSYSTCFDSESEQFGWSGNNDFELDDSFTKLDGPYGGSGSSWVSNATANYGTGGLVHSVFSPFFNFSSISGDVYVSFVHSIKTEPAWDRSQLQYSIDTGKTWLNIGVLNDPNGTNWYDESLYANAATFGDCIDSVNVLPSGFNFGPAWTTSGDCGGPGGFGTYPDPSGWIFAANKLPAVLNGKPMVRFRYAAFSDAASNDDGWAFDCFELGTSPASFAGTISGTKWGDTDGDGTLNGGETVESGIEIELKYYGVTVGKDTTDGSGDYSFNLAAPGIYTVFANDGLAKTVPAEQFWTIDHNGNDAVDADFGNYDGSISGVKFNDVNGNGTKDGGDLGLAGWTIEMHVDSANGELIASDVTDSLGNYSIPAPPGTYYVKEVAQASGRNTFPVSGYHTVTISGNSGSGTAVVTGKDFGNFLFADLTVNLTVDINGDGSKSPGDVIPIDVGTASFSVKKNGTDISGSPFVLGAGVGSKAFANLDTGTYTITETVFNPGWIRTLAQTTDFVVNASDLSGTRNFMDFKLITISGTKFEDVNGNGSKDTLEAGLEGWTINVTGGTYYGDATATTDGDGNYSIDSVGPGTHTVAEVLQSGWSRTLPGGAGTYSINGISGNLITNADERDFGNFSNVIVSGVVYRDYNGNGAMDPEDTPISGIDVSLAVNGGTDASDGSGYSFEGVITDDTVRIVVPGGFAVTDPVAGEHVIGLVSGGSATGLNFGLFQVSDSASKYRTFTAEQYGADDQKKAGKAPKPGKAYDPVKNKATTSYMAQYLIDPKKGLGLQLMVGLSDQTNAGGKPKAHFYPGKQGDFWKSLNNKSQKHTGMARGFDQDLKGKPILKRLKSFPPNKKQNNKLFAELAALEMNLLASGITTPAGLGSLIYSDPLSSLDGMTVDEISDYGDTVMTNYEFKPLGVYLELDTVVAKINAAFASGVQDDTLNGWATPPLTWKAYTSVQDVPYLKPNPGVSPKNRHIRTEQEVPAAFALEQNYPNPFNPTTTIEFDLPDESIVTLKVYNLLGQEVATLLNREIMDLGDAVEFDASTLPSGVYLYRIVAETIVDAESGDAPETFTQVKKMVLLK